MLGIDKAADEIMGEINEYMEPVFEDICRQYLIRRAKTGTLLLFRIPLASGGEITRSLRRRMMWI